MLFPSTTKGGNPLDAAATGVVGRWDEGTPCITACGSPQSPRGHRLPTEVRAVRQLVAMRADAGYGVAAWICLMFTLSNRSLIKPLRKAGQIHGSGVGKKHYVVEQSCRG